MDVFEKLESTALKLRNMALSSCQSPVLTSSKEEETLTHLLRIKEQVANQCFEMEVRTNAESENIDDSIPDKSSDICKIQEDLENAKFSYCNKVLALHNMQVTQAILENIKRKGKEAELMMATINHTLSLCSRIEKMKQESRETEEQLLEIQKKRLELKKLNNGKMKEIQELKMMCDHPERGKYSEILKQGQKNLDKYLQMVAVVKNVFQGIIIASKVNWAADSKLKDVILGMEDNLIVE
ncbi:centromere protein H [Lepisosteus oculatus]|uniref:centromere protein H n=1 Tax=Lepisosteus oculatus TaxID=7918 RepID=UPI00371B3E0D